MTPVPPKAIVFDLLTGLLNSWTAWDRAAASATNSSAEPTSAEDAETTSAGFEWRKHYLALTFGTGAYRPYETLVHEAAARAGLPASAAEALLANWDAWIMPWPETSAVLKALRAKGYKLGVVTNCSIELGRRAAALCGVEFDVVVTAEESGWYKPVPAAYTAILEQLNVQVQDVLFVAGSPGDVAGAHGAGLRVVWHNHIGLPAVGDVPPEREGKSLDEALEGVL
ncbi:2-deoxyglucose-6-phosphate phosphatase [Peniophora sp. CONT]|nr:2-deoxyglucose-6-phosphate phosphatase [Peniophora sp. CONT]